MKQNEAIKMLEEIKGWLENEPMDLKNYNELIGPIDATIEEIKIYYKNDEDFDFARQMATLIARAKGVIE